MSYRALYRVWRPQTFSDVIGQKHITQTLQNALRSQSYTHAYLFSGPRGTGKTSTAKIMAKAVNCQQAPAANPCNACFACQSITEGQNVDVVEIDAASNNGVDEIRDLRDKVKFAPTEVSIKVYIIDEVHMLSQGAFNALLKTLEEPPEHVIFLLATTEPHKIPLTIVSRCQRFDFRRVSRTAMYDRLVAICHEEQIDVEEEALRLLVQVAEGGMRDALSLLDQSISFAQDKVTVDAVLAITGSVHQDTLVKLAHLLLTGEVEEAIRTLDGLMEEGKEAIRLVEDLIYYYRDILMFRSAPEVEDVLERVHVTDAWKKQIQDYDEKQLFAAIERFSQAQQEMKWSHHPRIFLEVAMVQLAQEMSQQTSFDNQSVPAATASTAEQGKGASPQTVTILEDEWQQLKQDMKDMQRQMERLQQGNVLSQGSAFANVESKRESTARSAPSPSVSDRKLKEMLKTASKSLLIQFNEQWSSILDEIKSRQIMVHAWLRDGKPVACSGQFFLLAFQNDIHRETTEKESHRQLIEDVVNKRFQTEAKMITIMYNEWQEIRQQFIREQKAGPPSSTEEGADNQIEGPEKDGAGQEGHQDAFYTEAVKLVGEDLIEIKEDSAHEKHG